MNTYLHGEIKICTKNTLIYEFSCTSDPQTCHRECILRTCVRHSYVTQAYAYRCVARMRCRRTRGYRVWSSAQSSSPTCGTASTGPSAPSLVRVLYRCTRTILLACWQNGAFKLREMCECERWSDALRACARAGDNVREFFNRLAALSFQQAVLQTVQQNAIDPNAPPSTATGTASSNSSPAGTQSASASKPIRMLCCALQSALQLHLTAPYIAHYTPLASGFDQLF